MTVLVDRRGDKRIVVQWGTVTHDVFSQYLHAIRAIPGHAFVRKSMAWTVPLDLPTCRKLRAAFGDELEIGPDLRSWAVEAVRHEQQMGTLALAADATLTSLPAACPALAEALFPFQRGGVKFIAECPHPLVADQPGLGKTLEVIGGLFEAGVVTGPSLIIAPITALDSVWEKELLKWQPCPVFVPQGSRAKREAVVDAFAEADGPRWLVVNPAMVQYRRDRTNKGPLIIPARPKMWDAACKCDEFKLPHFHYEAPYPVIDSTVWSNIVIDECHKGSIRGGGGNQQTVTRRSINRLSLADGGKRVAMSGTPMTKHGPDLWGVLNWLRPDVFTSYWTMVEAYFEVEPGYNGSTKVKGLHEDRQDEFFEMLTPYVLRRTKADVLKDLPPKQFVDVWVTLEEEDAAKQRTQYLQMQSEGFAMLDDVGLNATSVLAEFMRLKQFAVARCKVRSTDGKVVPTEDSVKLRKLLELLEERGILDDETPDDQAEKVVVFSQFSEVVDLIVDVLRKRGVDVLRITGADNRKGQRMAAQEAFQADGGPRVIVMTTTAGGVAITLDRADTVIFMDELWSPADQEQAEDRVHRASRTDHQVTVYNIRTKKTIDSYIQRTAFTKARIHELILDIRRQLQAEKAASL